MAGRTCFNEHSDTVAEMGCLALLPKWTLWHCCRDGMSGTAAEVVSS
ncbi:hypothetical protein CKAN_00831500 [Cinnamomum micranthum f. kanehirae]|uniref:Uncharacterized protein n=1 Tax=Cinnamomum micranthum f. kanehirae TaxID=337451 RepID=A0A443NMF4_9MAGN|nr:hypothetical protein CKAN_00831500 [Cinnamomum micranthum f. kanehirae]